MAAAKNLKTQNELTAEEIMAVEIGALRCALIGGHAEVVDWLIDACGYTPNSPFITEDWENSEESLTMGIGDWLELARARNHKRVSASQITAWSS